MAECDNMVVLQPSNSHEVGHGRELFYVLEKKYCTIAPGIVTPLLSVMVAMMRLNSGVPWCVPYCQHKVMTLCLSDHLRYVP